MKSFMILVLVGLIVLVEYSKGQNETQYHDDITSNIRICRLLNNVSDDYISSFDFSAPKSTDEACFLACFEKTFEILNDNNTINIENYELWLTNYTLGENIELIDRLVEVYTLCNDQVNDEEDECIAAESLFKCIIPKTIDVLNNMNMTIEDYRNTFILSDDDDDDIDSKREIATTMYSSRLIG